MHDSKLPLAVINHIIDPIYEQPFIMPQSIEEMTLERPLLIGNFDAQLRLQIIDKSSLKVPDSSLHVHSLPFSLIVLHPSLIGVPILTNDYRPAVTLRIQELPHIQFVRANPNDPQCEPDLLHLGNEARIQGAVSEQTPPYIQKKQSMLLFCQVSLKNQGQMVSCFLSSKPCSSLISPSGIFSSLGGAGPFSRVGCYSSCRNTTGKAGNSWDYPSIKSSSSSSCINKYIISVQQQLSQLMAHTIINQSLLGSVQAVLSHLLVGLHIDVLEGRGLDVQLRRVQRPYLHLFFVEDIPHIDHQSVQDETQNYPLQVKHKEGQFHLHLAVERAQDAHYHQHQKQQNGRQLAPLFSIHKGTIFILGNELQLDIALALLTPHVRTLAVNLGLEIGLEALLMAKVVTLAERHTLLVGKVLLAVLALLAQALGPLLGLVDDQVALEQLLDKSSHEFPQNLIITITHSIPNIRSQLTQRNAPFDLGSKRTQGETEWREVDIIKMQQQKQQQSIVYQQTYQQFLIQLRVVEKIVKGQLWIGKKYFPQALIYQISRFVYKNPIRLKEPVYAHRVERNLRTNERILFKGKSWQNSLVDKNSSDVVKIQKSQERSAFITIVKQWKALNSNEYSYAEVISKGRLFLNFLSNIKIRIQPQENIEIDPLNDYNAYQKQIKEKNRYYALISDNINAVFSQFQEIFHYQKDKKINDILIKSFTHLMSKNIAIVKIEENFYTNMLGCEGKYIYVENNSCLPFIKIQDRKLTGEKLQDKIADFPWLEVDLNNEWRIGFPRHSLSLYRQQSYPLSRQRKWLLNKKMQYYFQQDVWISKN